MNLSGLQHALSHPDFGGAAFVKEILPNIVRHALELPTRLTSLPDGRLPILKQSFRSKLDLPRALGTSLLACMFLCAFPRRPARSSMPSVSFLHLLGSYQSQEVAKLQMFINYFRRVGGECLNGRLSFE